MMLVGQKVCVADRRSVLQGEGTEKIQREAQQQSWVWVKLSIPPKMVTKRCKFCGSNGPPILRILGMWRNREFLPVGRLILISHRPVHGGFLDVHFNLKKHTSRDDLRICSGFMGFGGCVEGIKAAMEAKEKECKKKKELVTWKRSGSQDVSVSPSTN